MPTPQNGQTHSNNNTCKIISVLLLFLTLYRIFSTKWSNTLKILQRCEGFNVKSVRVVRHIYHVLRLWEICNKLCGLWIMYKVKATWYQLSFSCIMLKNGQTSLENLVVWTPEDCQSMFCHFSAICMKRLNIFLINFDIS